MWWLGTDQNPPRRILSPGRHIVGVSSQEIKREVGSRKELMDAAKGETGQRRERRTGEG